MIHLRRLDYPPLWLLLCLFVVWASPWQAAWGAQFLLGIFLLGLAAALTLAAVVAFAAARTTIIPHRSPSALITSGIFRWTRNPIYLADLLILLGFALISGRLLGFVVLPLFFLILDRRFVRGEEERLRAAFGEPYDRYCETTRRWV